MTEGKVFIGSKEKVRESNFDLSSYTGFFQDRDGDLYLSTEDKSIIGMGRDRDGAGDVCAVVWDNAPSMYGPLRPVNVRITIEDA